MKTCSVCNQEKDESEFRKQSSCRDGYKNKCKNCDDEYQKNRYQNKKQSYINKVRVWQKSNPAKVARYKAEYFQRAKNK